VTVYLLAHERYMACIPAQALAGRMFAAIGISLEWVNGKPDAESSPPPIIIEVVMGAPENFKPRSLAYALPYEGSHITVFVDRIENMRAPGNVLAHVMVHEIAHILQGISRHSATGVMKARWTSGDFADMRFRPLPFTPLDIELIYSGLALRTARAAIGLRFATVVQHVSW
jgi:Zn-dependent protease with chaperone function